QAIAQKTKATILGSLIISENGKYYNRLLVVNPDGTSHHYDKKHLFAYAGEDEAFSAGNERLIFNLKGWKVCPMVCYDLRFPAWARNSYDATTDSAAYDLLLYVANWPKPRINAWDALLTARAIENQSYVAGVNRIGLDDNKNEYIGLSAVYDFLGDTVARFGENEGLTTTKLSASSQDAFRKKLPFLQDGDEFSIL
ncbi:MAG: omega-amidase, partial [Saprospiraceae bacterium]